MTRSLVRGGRLSVVDPRLNNVMEIFNLCSEFKCLPSQLLSENSRWLEYFKIIMNEREKEKERIRKKNKRKSKRMR